MSGIENPDVIDLVAFDESSQKVVLVAIETRPWNGSRERLMQLQKKLNRYLEFGLDGELASRYPDYKGKRLRIELDTKEYPDPDALEFLEQAKDVLAKEGVELVVSPREIE